MTIIRDILDTLKDISSFASSGLTMNDAMKRRNYSSISRRSMEGTLQFPVLVSKSQDLETLQMITKALERQFASFVQTSLTMNPFLNTDRDKDAFGYLRKFHQNSDVKTTFNDFQNTISSVLDNYDAFVNEDASLLLIATLVDGSSTKVVIENKEQLSDIMEGLREDILNDKFIPRKSATIFKNKSLGNYHNTVTEAKDEKRATRGNSTDDNGMSNYQLPNELLKNNDAKKANELVPTSMHVRAIMQDKDGKQQGTMDFLIGIKATMHPVTSEEVVTNMVNAVKAKNKFFNTIRWTSGEISFFKDFILNLTEIKNDVSNRSAGSSPWWIGLKRRRSLAKIKSAFHIPNQILPNATIVLSMEEVDYIKSQYGYDLTNVTFVDKIMQEYFLLGFVIVDNSSQIAHFLFDGHQDFQVVTFSGLERDNKSGGGVDFKDVMKLVQRI